MSKAHGRGCGARLLARGTRPSVGALALGMLLSALLGGQVMAAGHASADSLSWSHGSWNMIVSPARDPYVGLSTLTPRTWFSSYATFERATVPAGAWVMYDIERASPEVEWQHPGEYLRLFITLARARGLHVVVAPAPNIPTDWMPVARLADLVDYQLEFVPRPLPLLRALLPFVPRNKLVFEQITGFCNVPGVWLSVRRLVGAHWVWTRPV
jgi:hypothetical protein